MRCWDGYAEMFVSGNLPKKHLYVPMPVNRSLQKYLFITRFRKVYHAWLAEAVKLESGWQMILKFRWYLQQDPPGWVNLLELLLGHAWEDPCWNSEEIMQ